jgi:hypothetical protein
MMDETAAKRIANVFRRLGSNFEGEIVAAVNILKRTLANEGLSINDIASVLESCNGAIEERKYSDADAAIIFARGIEKGRAEQREQQQAPPEFYDIDGRPIWGAIARWCQQQSGKLRSDWEKTFVNDMAGRMVWSQPTEKQSKHLMAIFLKLGGYYDPKYDPKTSSLRR